MDHHTGPSNDDVDLNFTPSPAGSSLPAAVDEHGLPVTLASTRRPLAPTEAPTEPRADDYPGDRAGGDADRRADSGEDPDALDLPHGDWTKIDGEGRWPWPPGSRAGMFAKATVVALVVMVLIPLLFMLAPLVGLGTTGP